MNWRDHITTLTGPEKYEFMKHPLNTGWVLWYHTFESNDWSLKGYEKLYTFNTIEDFWFLYNYDGNYSNGMYYLMRKGIPPIWDAPETINGGAWTFRIDYKVFWDFWQSLSMLCIGETICTDSTHIIGISYSPKGKFFICRVWTDKTDGDLARFGDAQKECVANSLPIDFNTLRFVLNKRSEIV